MMTSGVSKIRTQRISFVLSIILGIFVLMTTNYEAFASSEKDYQAYIWQDSSGLQYVTIQSENVIAPERIFQDYPEIKFIPVNNTPKALLKEGDHVQTFQLASQKRTSFPLLERKQKAVAYLAGETHIGQSQVRVTETIVELIKNYEIDAILLEQPDYLSYNWQNFKRLSDFPAQAIASLQQKMFEHANQMKPYFELSDQRGKILEKYQEEAQSVETYDELYQEVKIKYGDKDAQQIIELQNLDIERQSILTPYKNSEYISASDYLYIMLNLKGIRLPFYNIENETIRILYKLGSKDLNDRDVYMSSKAEKIIEKHHYRQVILICGAAHLDNLKTMLEMKNFHVIIAYDSRMDKFKEKITILEKPDYVLELASQPPTDDFAVSENYISNNEPSQQLLQSFDTYFATGKGDGLTLVQFEQLRANFITEYEKQGLKSQPNWTMQIPINGKIGVFVKDIRTNSFIIDIVDTPHNVLKFVNPEYFDFQNSERLRKINQNNKDSILLTIENKNSYYIVSSDDEYPIYEGSNIDALLEKVNEIFADKTLQTVYFDMKYFTPDEVEGFKTSCTISQRSLNPEIETKPLSRDEENGTVRQDIFFSDTFKLEEETETPLQNKAVNDHEPSDDSDSKRSDLQKAPSVQLQNAQEKLNGSHPIKVILKTVSKVVGLVRKKTKTFYRFTAASFISFEKTNFSPPLLNTLRSLQNQQFSSLEALIWAIEHRIGAKLSQEERTLIEENIDVVEEIRYVFSLKIIVDFGHTLQVYGLEMRAKTEALLLKTVDLINKKVFTTQADTLAGFVNEVLVDLKKDGAKDDDVQIFITDELGSSRIGFEYKIKSIPMS